MRKPSRKVGIEDIISNNILGDDPEVIALAIKIHLALEAIIIEIISIFRNDEKIFIISFPDKTALLEKEGRINGQDRAAFNQFNDFRNDFAHIFGHNVTLEEALALARDLENNGVDFSDSIGRYSVKEATEYYGGMVGVLEEIGWCILLHASYRLSEAGGREIFAE